MVHVLHSDGLSLHPQMNYRSRKQRRTVIREETKRLRKANKNDMVARTYQLVDSCAVTLQLMLQLPSVCVELRLAKLQAYEELESTSAYESHKRCVPSESMVT